MEESSFASLGLDKTCAVPGPFQQGFTSGWPGHGGSVVCSVSRLVRPDNISLGGGRPSPSSSAHRYLF